MASKPNASKLTEQVRGDAESLRSQYGDLPLLLFIGRLRHYKGVDVLIRAMHDIHAQLLIIGTGQMQEAWQYLTQAESLTDKVVFLGDASERETLAARYAADLFVLPSTNRAEALGIVQLEAMACGMPVVCTELGTGTSYVNRDGATGLVVPPNDPRALAVAINRLLASPALRAKMGVEGRRRVRSEFSLQEMINVTIAFYEEALRKS